MKGFWEGMSDMRELGGILRRRRVAWFFWGHSQSCQMSPSAV